jgi:hypothetical protein
MMRASFTLEEWGKWKEENIKKMLEIFKLNGLEITLDKDQPNTKGERFLMSGKKLVLIGKQKNKKVVIKYSGDKSGIEEMESERENKHSFLSLDFIKSNFKFPGEIYWQRNKDYALMVTEFIEQGFSFIELPNDKQFYYMLSILESLDGVQATTTSHLKQITKSKHIKNAKDYLDQYLDWCTTIMTLMSKDRELMALLEKGKDIISAQLNLIQKYSSTLTHTDLVPHNFRIYNEEIYFLDHTSLIFGNKYENWARLINFMAIYNRELENNLVKYVKNNKSAEELLMLKIMRIFKISQLIEYNAKSYHKSEGDLKRLCSSRLKLFTRMLSSLMQDSNISDAHHKEFISDLNNFRTQEEKERQKSIYGPSKTIQK